MVLFPWKVNFSLKEKDLIFLTLFIRRAGVLYRFRQNSDRIPEEAIAFVDGICEGCRRISGAVRPHVFEIILKSNTFIQFAAPDEYEASEWLQALVQAASGVSNEFVL